MPAKPLRGKAPVGSPAREPLSYALASRAKVACLRVLAPAGAPMTQREVARRAGVQHRSAQLALDELVDLGIVQRLTGGRDFLVSLSRKHHLTVPIENLFRTETEMFLALRRDLAAAVGGSPRNARPLALALFGSIARGDDGPSSDADVLVILAEEAGIQPALAHLAAAGEEIRNRYGREVRPIAYTVAEARRRHRRREAPFPEIVRDHIVLAGPPLRELLNG